MKLLSLSDWTHRFVEGNFTGFGRVHYHLLSYLHSQGHKVYEVGVGYVGQATTIQSPWPVISPTAYGRMEGQDCIPQIANQLEVDAVLILADVPDIAYLSIPLAYRDRREGRPLREDIIAHIDAGDWKKICYTVIDGSCPNDRIPAEWEPIFRGFDGVSIATKWGCDLVEKNTHIKPMYFPHGVDTNLFKPVDKTIARQRFSIKPDAFVILGVGVNRKRKAIPAWFEAVAKFVEKTGANNVLFWLNSYKAAEAMGYDLQALTDHYNFRELGIQAILTDRMPEEAMSFMYSASDVVIHLSGGEGFGLVPLEAAACRTPTLVTDYTGQVEQVPDTEDNFLKIPVKVLIPQEGNIIRWAWADTDIAAERLEILYKEPKFKTKLKRASWEHAQRFKWESILPRYEQWLKAVVEEKENAQALKVSAL